MKKIVFLFILFIQSITFAQVKFEAKVSKSSVGLNERIQISFSINEDADNFTEPNFEGFSVVGGPFQSTNFSWINGVKSFNRSYTYILQPIKKGTFVIKSATIEYNDEVLKTVPLKIIVTDAIPVPKDPNSPDYVAGEGVHLVAEISNSNPYVNEPLTVVYKLYFDPRFIIRNVKELKNPKYNGFWSQFIDIQKLEAVQATYNGQDYAMVVWRKVILYPLEAGNKPIEPLSINLEIQVPSGRRNIFGQQSYQMTTKTVTAGSKTINVKPLPEKGKPEGFSGAVGSFDFKLKTNKKELKTSEAFEVNLEVSGNGNLKLFKLPALILPSALEVYEPEHIEKVRTLVSGMRGRITDSYTVVPNDPGSYPIPSVSFSYFDLKSKRYKTLRSERLIITVNAGAEQSNRPEGKTNKNTNVADVKQFQPFRTTANFSPVKSKLFFRSFLFWVLLLGPFLLIPAFLFFIRSRKARALDVVGNKIRRTNRLARKYLSEAKNSLGQKDQFYNALERALHNYLKSKLRIETSDFSKDKVRELLNDKKIGLTDLEGFVSVLTSCEIARYTPLSSVDMENDFEKAAQVIIKLDKQLK